jgi:hypothetical protein
MTRIASYLRTRGMGMPQSEDPTRGKLREKWKQDEQKKRGSEALSDRFGRARRMHREYNESDWTY